MDFDPTQLEPAAIHLTVAEAQVVVGLAAVASDGDVADIELTTLVDALDVYGILPDLDEEEREDFVLWVVGHCDNEGLGPALGAAIRALLDRTDRLLALELAVEVLASDGQIPEAEVVYLHALKDALGVSDDDFDRLTS